MELFGKLVVDYSITSSLFYATASEAIRTPMPTTVVRKLHFNVRIVPSDAAFHSPSITDNISACPVVIIMSIGHPTDDATLAGNSVVEQTP